MLKLRSSKMLMICLLGLVQYHVTAQKPALKTTRDLLLQQHFENPSYSSHKRSFLTINSKSAFIRYNPVSLGFGLAMYAYQNVISPHFSAGCLYSPSCSEFSKALIKDRGLFAGIFLTADRLTRCNRMAAQDINKTYIDPKDHRVHETTAIYHFHP